MYVDGGLYLEICIDKTNALIRFQSEIINDMKIYENLSEQEVQPFIKQFADEHIVKLVSEEMK